MRRRILLGVVLLFLAVGIAARASAQSGQHTAKQIPLGKLLGSWQSDDGRKIQISKIDDHNLSLKGGTGAEWRGTYEGGVFHFSVKPTAGQMNHEIPDWAREQVARLGTLTWKLSLTPSEESDGLKLTGEMLPGEVHVRDVTDSSSNETVKRQAEVTGEPGTPLKLTYTKSTNWRISDTLVMSAKVTKVTGNGASCDYVLFAYGPSLPGSANEAKSVLSDSPGVEYSVLAAGPYPGTEPLMTRGWAEALDRVPFAKAALMRKEYGALLIKAKVGYSVYPYPGRYTYKVGSAAGGWFLSQGAGKANLTIMRDPVKTPSEQADYAYPGERIHAQLQANTFLTPWKPDIPLKIGLNGTPMFVTAPFAATAASGRTNGLFTSPTIHLVASDDPALPAGSSVAMVGGELLLAVEPGDSVQIGLANPRELLTEEPVANINIASDDEGLWVDALRRAAAADGLPKDADLLSSENLRASSGREVDQVTNVIISQVLFKLQNLNENYNPALYGTRPVLAFIHYCYGQSAEDMAHGDVIVKNKITLGDQAAALLLRDEFVERMVPLVETLKGITKSEDMVGYMRALKSEIVRPNSPIGSFQFTVPNGTVRMMVRELFTDPTWTKPYAGNSQSLHLAWAFQAYRKSVIRAQQRAIDVPDGNVQGLIDLTGDSFSAVVKTLTPKLMRPVRDAKGATTWEPDMIARDRVNGVAASWAAIKAQKDWSAIDSDFAITAGTLALQIVGSGNLVLRTLSAAANVAAGVHGAVETGGKYFYEDPAKIDFAIGSYRVLGSEPFDMAEAQKTPAWSLALNLVGLGLVSLDVLNLTAEISAGRAMTNAPILAAKIEKEGIKALSEARPEEVAEFIEAAVGVESKSAVAANDLTIGEKGVARAEEAISQELKDRGGFQVQEPEERVQNAVTQPPVEPKPSPAKANDEVANAPALPPERAPLAKGTQTELLPDLNFQEQVPTQAKAAENPVPVPQPQPPQPPVKTGDPRAPPGPEKTAVAYRLNIVKGEKLDLQGGKFNNQVSALKQKGWLPANFPENSGEWRAGEVTLILGQPLGEDSSMFFLVVREADKPSVIKVLKWSWGHYDIPQVHADMELAEKLLTAHNILHLKMELQPLEYGETMWLRQELLPSNAVIPKAAGLLSPGQRTATMDLMEELMDNVLAFEDFKGDNVYLVPRGDDLQADKWAMGVLDVDRVCTWGEKYSASMDFFLEQMELGTVWIKNPWGRPLIPGSPSAQERLMTLAEFYKIQLVKGGWLGFSNDQFVDGKLLVKEVFDRFPWLGKPTGRINLRGRPPSRFGGPPTVPPSLMVIPGRQSTTYVGRRPRDRRVKQAA